MAEKRKRGQNFSTEEKERLIKLLVLHKETILNKKTDGSTNEAKSKAWIDVTNAFNASATTFRSKESLIKVWEKMRSESKLYYQLNKKSITGTGGGPSEVKVDPILEQVCSVMGRACTGIEGVQDSDADIVVPEIPSKKLCAAVDDVLCNNLDIITEYTDENKQIATASQQLPDHLLPVLDTNGEKNEQLTPKTPLWSRRRPQLSLNNERTEAVSSLCASFSDVNKKKTDIEELKRQIYEEELSFKRKLYELQLQAAAKEVEIKTEILNQVKGGAMNIQQLFGVPRKEL